MADVLVASPADISRADASLPTRWGDFRISVFRFDGTEVVALSRGEIDGAEPVLVRLHSECLTGDLLGSLRCDRGDQLHSALAMIGGASVERIPIETRPNAVTTADLHTTAWRMGRRLDGLPDPRRVDAATIPDDRPLVTVHCAQTIDGRIASRTGDSRWVRG